MSRRAQWKVLLSLLVIGTVRHTGVCAESPEQFPAAQQASGLQQPVTVNWYHVGIQDALSHLAKRGQLSLAVSPAVSGRLNYMRVSDVPLADALTVLLQSQGLRQQRTGQVYTVMTEAEYAARHADTPAESFGAPAPVAESGAMGSKPVSLDFRGPDILQAIRRLTEDGDLDVVVDPDVGGPGALTVNQIPAREALQALADSHGLTTEKHGSIIRVMKRPSAGTAGSSSPAERSGVGQ